MRRIGRGPPDANTHVFTVVAVAQKPPYAITLSSPWPYASDANVALYEQGRGEKGATARGGAGWAHLRLLLASHALMRSGGWCWKRYLKSSVSFARNHLRRSSVRQ